MAKRRLADISRVEIHSSTGELPPKDVQLEKLIESYDKSELSPQLFHNIITEWRNKEIERLWELEKRAGSYPVTE